MNMKIIYCVLLSLTHCFLAAQNRNNFSDLSKIAIAQKSIALIVITTPADNDSIAKSMRLVLSDPDILPYRVNLTVVSSNGGLAIELRSHNIWENRNSGWAIIGPDGKLVAANDNLPDVETLKTVLTNTKSPIPLIELQRFYRQNTNRIDILLLILEEHLRIGEGKLLRLYGNQIQNENFAISDDHDHDFWSEYARLFKTNIIDIIGATSQVRTNSDLQLYGRTFTGRILPTESAISSSHVLKEMARSTLQHIEQELIYSPYNDELWRFWSLLRPNNGGMQIETFVDSILQNRFREQKPTPTSTLINVLQKEEKWRKITELLVPIWDDLLEQSVQSDSKNRPQGVMVGGVPIDIPGASQNQTLTSNQWRLYIFPLFQAYVKSGSFTKADELIKKWMKENGWSGARNAAREYVLAQGGNLPSENWPD